MDYIEQKESDQQCWHTCVMLLQAHCEPNDFQAVLNTDLLCVYVCFCHWCGFSVPEQSQRSSHRNVSAAILSTANVVVFFVAHHKPLFMYIVWVCMRMNTQAPSLVLCMVMWFTMLLCVRFVLWGPSHFTKHVFYWGRWRIGEAYSN